VKFSELFETAASRSEVVCTFLALLELIRLHQLICAQPEEFGEIEIRRAAVVETPAPAAPKLPSEGSSGPARTEAPPLPAEPAATPEPVAAPAPTEINPQSS
jgi:segregation and condensation protein A